MYKKQQQEFPGRETDITCLDSSNNVAYVYATDDKPTMSKIQKYMNSRGIPCNKSSISKFQLDEESKLTFALYNAIDRVNQEEHIPLWEIISRQEPLGAYIAMKTYFISDNYYQVKFLDRYMLLPQVLSCQYVNYRFDCFAKNYTDISFDCPKTELLAKQYLSDICTPTPTHLLK